MVPKFIPYNEYQEYSEEEMKRKVDDFYTLMRKRRTVRTFSDRPVDREIIEKAILAAGTAPSGANMQPWKFVAVSSQTIKEKIRVAAEEEEKDFYTNRAPQEWLEALAPLGTDENKPFIEQAPWLIAVFAERYGKLHDGRLVKHYYVQESVGIAVGILLTALHSAGLVALTHTPSPMGFLNDILGRGENERPFLIVITGYPEPFSVIPDIHKKGLQEISEFFV